MMVHEWCLACIGHMPYPPHAYFFTYLIICAFQT
jgi:hypothetical protein